jgi:hypothetical protein
MINAVCRNWILCCILLLGFVMSISQAFAQDTPTQSAPDSESARMRERIGTLLERFNLSASEMVQRLKVNIDEKYHVQATCDEGFILGIWNGLDDGECLAGLEKLNAALAHSKLPLPRVDDFKVQVGKFGQWQSLTQNDHQIVLPFDATAEHMLSFIKDQLVRGFNVIGYQME